MADRKLNDFKRGVRVYKNHFWDFYNKLDTKVQSKIDWTITLVQTTKNCSEEIFKTSYKYRWTVGNADFCRQRNF